MQVSEALGILGADRVIWIDDCFNETPIQLANLLINSLETAKDCGFDELEAALTLCEYDQATALIDVIQILTDLPNERRESIKAEFFKHEGSLPEFATGELSESSVDRACTLLGVTEADRWTFDKAEQDLASLCAEGDERLSYVVDLNESGGSKTRGLDILRKLWREKSKGTAFILTHETNIAGESDREAVLLGELADLDGLGLPLCVIAKERLYDKDDDADAM